MRKKIGGILFKEKERERYGHEKIINEKLCHHPSLILVIESLIDKKFKLEKLC